VSDPERKRKIIGKEFMDVFEAEALKIKDADFLAQGTLIPGYHRIPVGLRRPHGGDQIPPQCGWAAQKDEAQTG
jgi:hypothetical protein